MSPLDHRKGINRRNMLGWSAAASVAAAGIGQGSIGTGFFGTGMAMAIEQTTADQQEDRTPPKIIDTHQHLWDLDRFNVPWLEGNESLNRSFLLDDYLEATKATPIHSSIYMEVDVAKDEKLREAEYIIELCNDASNRTVAAVLSGQPTDPGFEEYAKRLAEAPVVKGIRHLLIGGTPKGTCLETEYAKGIKLLGELGLRFDICIRPTELIDGATLVQRCPDTSFVLDHCGNADPVAFASPQNRWKEPSHTADDWKRAIDAYGECTNVMCKISGIVARVRRDNWQASDLAPIVNHCREAFGPDRLMFASDWPVCTNGAPLQKWIGALREIVADWPAEQQEKLFHQNATRFYELGSVE